MGSTTPSADERSVARAVVGGVAVLALAPLAVAARWWARLRRGTRSRCEWAEAPAPPARAAFDLELDAVEARWTPTLLDLTDTFVRIAEALHEAGDTHTLLTREPGQSGSTATVIGPRLHDLGERFRLAMGRPQLMGCTMVWLALPPGLHLARLTDPTSYDPEATGEPDGLLASPGARWGAASAWHRRGASVGCRLVLRAPGARRELVRSLLDRFCIRVRAS